VSLDFDPERCEAKVALKYDHHAFAISEATNVNNIRLPREAESLSIGKVF
jgi:hypothetical protein